MTTFILVDEFGDAVQTPELTPILCQYINEGNVQIVLRLEDANLQIRQYAGHNVNGEPYFKYIDVEDLDMAPFESL